MADTVMMRYLLMILAAGLIMASASSQAADPNRPGGYETPSLKGAKDAADLGAAEQATIRHVIASQLAAFQRDDALEAFSYASPGIQRRFANPENFKYVSQRNTFYLSSVLKWFGEDFGRDQVRQLRTIAPYLPDAPSRQAARRGAVRVSYLDYDWSLNEQSK